MEEIMLQSRIEDIKTSPLSSRGLLGRLGSSKLCGWAPFGWPAETENLSLWKLERGPVDGWEEKLENDGGVMDKAHEMNSLHFLSELNPANMLLHHKVVQNVRTLGFILSWSTSLHVSELYNGTEYRWISFLGHRISWPCPLPSFTTSWGSYAGKLKMSILSCRVFDMPGPKQSWHAMETACLATSRKRWQRCGTSSCIACDFRFSRHVSLLVYHVYMQEYMRACVHMYMFVCMFPVQNSSFPKNSSRALCQVGP